nr:hypothetical protein [Tanacetum cinerariifolium]
MFEAITIKTTFYKKLSINQECQDLRSNPSKDRELDSEGKVRDLDIGGDYCRVLPEADHCQTLRYTVNHPIFSAHNDLFTSQTTIMEQMEQLTSMCEMFCQVIQKKQEEKRIEEEQAAKAQKWKLPVCYDDDDDEERSNSLQDNIIFGLPPCSAITPNKPVDSLSMRDEHLNTIPAMESDEFIKSCVENLPNPSESEGENGCDVLACFTTFLNILFEADYESDSSDYQSCSDEDFPEEIFSNPLFEEEIIHMNIDQHHFNVDLLNLAGSQPMLKSSYKAEDGVIISIPPLVKGVTDVVVKIKGTGCKKPGHLADKAGTFREERLEYFDYIPVLCGASNT